MVSDDSTSRVMVLPVTARLLVTDNGSLGLRSAKGLIAAQRRRWLLTGLDEDLHVVGCGVCSRELKLSVFGQLAGLAEG
jgi:hypothetical protein